MCWEWVNDWYDGGLLQRLAGKQPTRAGHGNAPRAAGRVAGSLYGGFNVRAAFRYWYSPDYWGDARVSVCPLAMILVFWFLEFWYPGTGGVGGYPHRRLSAAGGSPPPRFSGSTQVAFEIQHETLVIAFPVA